MTYIIAVFRSRNETVYFANLLRNKNVQVDIVNTPKEAGLTCGISVRFNEKYLSFARFLLNSKPFRAFQGFYRVNTTGQNYSYERLN